MLYRTNTNGEIQPVSPARIARIIESVGPTLVSVRGMDGNEMTIGDVAIDVRPNGIHVLLDCPEACLADDD
jgi:hypothetical protein